MSPFRNHVILVHLVVTQHHSEQKDLADRDRPGFRHIRITCDNISTSLTKSASSRVFNSFFIPFAHTPTVVQPVVSRGERCAAILGFLSNLRTRFVSLHRLGVAHQTSLRSPATMMMYSNSPQAHYRFPAVLFRDGRTLGNQSGHASKSCLAFLA